MGSSRSASVIIYYLMRNNLINFEEALLRVLKLRPLVNLNINFADEFKYLEITGHFQKKKKLITNY